MRKLYCIFIFVFLHSIVSAQEIRNITPPNLNDKNFSKKIVCFRPVRKDFPRMDIITIDKKTIVNNYGHGGDGFSMAPGSVNHVLSLLEQKIILSKDEPISIIGAGIIGLFSALELVDRGYNNITIIAKSFQNLTSHNAGGVFSYLSVSNTKMQKIVHEIIVKSYLFYKDIANGHNKYLDKNNSKMMPMYSVITR